MLIFGITQRSGNRKRLDVQHGSKDQWCMNDPFISVNTLKVDGPLHLWNMITRVSIVAQNRTVVVSDCQQHSYSGLRSPGRSCSFYLFLMVLNFLKVDK